MELHPETDRVLVDSGYDNSSHLHLMEKQYGVVVYCPPEERKEVKPSEEPKEAKPPPRRSKARQRTVDFREGMKACMRTSYGRTVRQVRATTVEPVIGWIKDTLGFRRFHLRGEGKVAMEWELVCLAFNLTLMHRVKRAGKAVAPA
jgi:hypothetical protein